MKIAAIIVRNKRNHFGGEFGCVLDAFADAGYPADKVFILQEGETHEFSQTVIECKNFFDAVVVSAEAKALPALRAKAAELLHAESSEPWLEAGNKLFLFAPFGEEGEASVRATAVPRLAEKSGVRYGSSVFRAVGVPAARLEETVRSAAAAGEGKLTVNAVSRFGEQRIEILYDSNAPKMPVDAAAHIVAESLNDYVYAIDDTPLGRRAVELLKLRGMKVSVAESFTGGGVAARLVEVPGASRVLHEGIVGYPNDARAKRLGVSREPPAQHGAVSDETAYEMAAGLLAGGKCDAAVATTGIAGPSSDGTDKPVGLCYIAAGTNDAIYVYKYIFRGSRRDITERAINQALFLLCKVIR